MAIPPPVRIALGSDEATPLTDALLDRLSERGCSVERFGAVLDGGNDWPAIGRAVGEAVRSAGPSAASSAAGRHRGLDRGEQSARRARGALL